MAGLRACMEQTSTQETNVASRVRQPTSSISATTAPTRNSAPWNQAEPLIMWTDHQALLAQKPVLNTSSRVKTPLSE